jgi:hypothetical protein
MPNIKFNYLYCDCGNYKKYTSIVFSNPNNIELSELEKLIRSKLIDGTWFYADDWKLPEIFLETFDYKIDPTWHEFESIEYTHELAKQLVSVEKLKELIEKTNWKS